MVVEAVTWQVSAQCFHAQGVPDRHAPLRSICLQVSGNLDHPLADCMGEAGQKVLSSCEKTMLNPCFPFGHRQVEII